MDTSPDLPVAPNIEKPRKFKWFRIAVSGFFLLLSLAFAVLWVSEHYSEMWEQNRGALDFVFIDPISQETGTSVEYIFAIVQRTDVLQPLLGKALFRIPFWLLWLPILLAALLASVPWLPWHKFRFSLRTLFIVMTVIAVLLGFIVWLTRG